MQSRERLCPHGLPSNLLEYAVVQLFSSPVGGGLHKCQHQRMRFPSFRRKLWLKQGGDIKAVSGRFYGANFTFSSAGYDGKSGFHGGPFVVGIDFEIAKKLLRGGVLRVERLKVRSWPQADFGNRARQFGRVFLPVRNGAGHWVNNNIFGARIVLSRVRILDAQHIAGALDERVLKTSTSAEKRPVATAREFDPFQHAVETLVGTAGRGPDSVQAFQHFLGIRGENGGSCDPLRIEIDLQLGGGML